MPKVKYNDPKVAKLFGGSAKTIRLKTKGQKVRFILGDDTPTMYGLHWLDRKAYSCPRVNSEKSCPRCEEGYELLRELKELNLEKDSKEYKEKKNKAMDKLPNISFYYPVLVVGGEGFEKGAFLVETVKTIYERFGDLQKKGKKLLDLVWELERTEKPGSYYALDDVATVDSVEVTPEHLEDLNKLSEIDIDSTMSYESILGYYDDPENISEKDQDNPLNVFNEDVNTDDNSAPF